MPNPERNTKTLAIRLDEELHAQLTALAQLNGLSITDAIRQSIEAYIHGQRELGDLSDRASQALEEIEREASARKSAIQALFGPSDEPATEPATTKRTGRRSAGDIG